nr:LysR substrate-binding domain-containing protein [Aureimonas sp. SA4125]
MPPLHLLRAFEATARMGSMRQAAVDLGTSHPVVSRHIESLESWMKTRLFEMGPRGAVLTHEGKTLFSAVGRAFRLITAAAAEINPPPSRRTIRIWCMPGLATRWLTPRLSSIRAFFDKGDIVIRASDRLPDLEGGEAEIMIGYGSLEDFPEGAKLLIRPGLFPAASAQWVELHGHPVSISTIPGEMMIHEDTRRHWAEWLEKAEMTIEGPLSGPRMSDANLGFDAALSGQGVSLVSRLLAANDLAAGRLIRLSDREVALGAYYIVTATSVRDYKSVATFTAWLKDSLTLSECDASPPEISLSYT